MSNVILSALVIAWFVIMVYALTRDHDGMCNPEDCESCHFPHCEGVNLQRYLQQPGSDGKSFLRNFQKPLDNNKKYNYNR